jgi:hypothetical protein
MLLKGSAVNQKGLPGTQTLAQITQHSKRGSLCNSPAAAWLEAHHQSKL